ncbi:MAG: alginate export family protein [Acidobacteria bacterium]|nr:alginate export family protein [Acidobacteriota bacterium]
MGKRAICAVLVALAAPGVVRAQAAGPAGARPGGEVGVEERLRSEAWNDIVDHDRQREDHRIQYRARTRLWARLDWNGRAELALGLNGENRVNQRPDAPENWDEVVFETLYAGFRVGEHLSVRAGRQDLMRGEGFVLFDGGALDGSRTAYFNALDVAWQAKTSRLELIAISNPARDQYLPRFNDRNKPLAEWDERALGLYFTRAAGPGPGVEAYWFYKTETDATCGPADPKFQPDRGLHTLGARVAGALGAGWSGSAELALQHGRQDERPGADTGDVDVSGWGGLAQVRKTFAGKASPTLALGYVGLSGDDPATADVEGWDPLFSRWPKWSELYIYSQVPERGVAYWTNLGMWQAEFVATPLPPLKLRATYYRMRAFERHPGGPLFGGGRARGDLYQLRADVKFNRNWRGHAVCERLEPGDFYTGADPGYFLRFEIVYAASHKFGPRPGA